MPPTSVTVVGGGITGLSAALHLSRRLTRSGIRINLIDRSQRTGGWVHSERVHLKDGKGHEAEVLVESGPRTLRPASKSILELVSILSVASGAYAPQGPVEGTGFGISTVSVGVASSCLTSGQTVVQSTSTAANASLPVDTLA